MRWGESRPWLTSADAGPPEVRERERQGQQTGHAEVISPGDFIRTVPIGEQVTTSYSQIPCTNGIRLVAFLSIVTI